MNYVITINQKEKWQKLVISALKSDIYHSWRYHNLHSDSCLPFMFVFQEQESFVAIPLLKRNIPESEYFDATSVYGYSGPISNRDFIDLDKGFIERFKKDFIAFLNHEKIITVFSRLNPFLNQCSLMENFGGVVDNGKVVIIDLTAPIEIQRSKYQERINRKIRQLKDTGYYVREASSDEDIETFASIYNANMNRLGASALYYFDETYFRNFLRSDEYDGRLLFVYDNTGYPISGAIIAVAHDIMHAHLLGTREEYLSLSPAKLLTDEITILGRKLGVAQYNLGGGLGYKEDSLFRWKTNFSKQTTNYYSWRYIVDEKIYLELLDRQNISPDLEIDFFPLYRAPKSLYETIN